MKTIKSGRDAAGWLQTQRKPTLDGITALTRQRRLHAL
jgi:hypothetical protein